MQKNVISIFQKINFCNYTFHTRIELPVWISMFSYFENRKKIKFYVLCLNFQYRNKNPKLYFYFCISIYHKSKRALWVHGFIRIFISFNNHNVFFFGSYHWGSDKCYLQKYLYSHVAIHGNVLNFYDWCCL